MNTRIFSIISVFILTLTFSSCTMTLIGSSVYVEQLYQSAEQLYTQQNYEGAITKYTEALIESEKSGVKTENIDKDFTTLANFKIAVTYSRLAEQTGNVSHYSTAIRLVENVAPTATVPKHQEGLTYLWGHILYRTEQYELAEEKFLQLIENFPNSPQIENAWYAIGQLNFKSQNYENSRIAFRHILAAYPTSEFKDDALYLIAQSFLDEENYELAYPEFDRFSTEEFKNYPEMHADAMYKSAYCLNQLDRHDEAISRYIKFIIKFPKSPLVTAAYFDQGGIFAKQKNYENARVNYELALQNTTDQQLQSEIQAAIGQMYFDRADYENAIAVYTALINAYPLSDFVADAKLGIADSQFQLERWNDAVSSYRAVIQHELQNGDGTEYVFTPYCFFQVGEAFYKFVTSQNETVLSEELIGTLEVALKSYQTIAKLFPDNPILPHASYGAIWTLDKLGHTADFQKAAYDFIQKYQNDPEFDIFAAEVQLRSADIKRTKFKQYVDAAEEYAQTWDYPPLPKFLLLKLKAKFFEGLSYYQAANSVSDDKVNTSADLRTEYLKKSVEAYHAAITFFSDDVYLKGVEEGRYDDFAERRSHVEACIMNAALSHLALENPDQTISLYMSIPDSSQHYQKTQYYLRKLVNNEDLVDEIEVVELESIQK